MQNFIGNLTYQVISMYFFQKIQKVRFIFEKKNHNKTKIIVLCGIKILQTPPPFPPTDYSGALQHDTINEILYKFVLTLSGMNVAEFKKKSYEKGVYYLCSITIMQFQLFRETRHFNNSYVFKHLV